MEGLKKMDIKVYELKAGDVVIFRFPGILNDETIMKIGNEIRESLPEDIKGLVLDESPEIIILKKVD